MAVRRKLTEKRRRAFIRSLGEHGNVSKAADDCGLSRATVYREKERDAENELPREDPAFGFNAEWEDTVARFLDFVETEALRRATQGVTRPIMYKGQQVGSLQEYSDRLLALILERRHPGYMPTVRQRVEGDENKPIRHQHAHAHVAFPYDLSQLESHELRRILPVLEKCAVPELDKA